MTFILATLTEIAMAVEANAGLPMEIGPQLPVGYSVVANVHIQAGQPLQKFEIVALVSKDEIHSLRSPKPAPPRPLLVFEQKDGHFVLSGRNDSVIMRADEGGQCDPFLDDDNRVVAKGRYFTVQNGVACGQHWTDYITFRLDDKKREFVFDNERREVWASNSSDRDDAEALVRVGSPQVIRDRSGNVTMFSAWRPLRWKR